MWGSQKAQLRSGWGTGSLFGRGSQGAGVKEWGERHREEEKDD